MRLTRAWIFALMTALLSPALLLAQELKTINKPGVMVGNASTDDEKGKPLKIKKGEKVTVIYSRDDWMWVKTKSGRAGWVLKKEVKVQDTAAADDKKKDEDKAAKQAAAEEAKRKKEEEKAAKKAAAEEAKRKRDEERAAKRAAAEEAKRKKAEEKAAKLAAAAEAKKKAEEEKAARRAAAEEAKKKENEKVTSVVPPVAEPAPAVAAVPAPVTVPPPQASPLPTEAVPAPVITDATATPVAAPAAGDPLAATTPGNTPLPETPSVSEIMQKEPAAAAAPAQLAPGFVTVHASEPGAVVLVDGRRVGEAPLLRLAVDGGKHNITVLKEDFNPSWQEIDVNGNEVAVNLALVPYPAYRDKLKRDVWMKRGASLGILAGTAAVAGLAGAAGLGGVLLWVASNSMNIQLQAYRNDTAQLERVTSTVPPGAAGPLGSPAAMVAGVALTVAAPAVALAIGVAGSVGAAALMMSAGDPGRYAQYQE